MNNQYVQQCKVIECVFNQLNKKENYQEILCLTNALYSLCKNKCNIKIKVTGYHNCMMCKQTINQKDVVLKPNCSHTIHKQCFKEVAVKVSPYLQQDQLNSKQFSCPQCQSIYEYSLVNSAFTQLEIKNIREIIDKQAAMEIEEEEKQLQKQRLDNYEYQCDLCKIKEKVKLMTTLVCNHRICNNKLRVYIENKIINEKQIYFNCPIGNCNKIINKEIFEELLKDNDQVQQQIQQLRQEQLQQPKDAVKVPQEWKKMQPDQNILIFQINGNNSPNYDQIINDMQQSNKQIISIEQIQNKFLYKNYEEERQKLILLRNNQECNEKMLYYANANQAFQNFHQGQKEAVTNLHIQTLAIGKGIYFSETPLFFVNKCFKDGDGSGHIYLMRVLVGVSKQQNVNQITNEFDTATGTIENQNIYVIFDEMNVRRCYPQYLIKFKY